MKINAINTTTNFGSKVRLRDDAKLFDNIDEKKAFLAAARVLEKNGDKNTVTFFYTDDFCTDEIGANVTKRVGSKEFQFGVIKEIPQNGLTKDFFINLYKSVIKEGLMELESIPGGSDPKIDKALDKYR